MIEEVHVLGVFVPAAMLWALLAALVTFPAGRLLQRVPLLNWHPHLVDITLFLLIWWAISVATDQHAQLLELL